MVFADKKVQKKYVKIRDKYIKEYEKDCEEVLVKTVYVKDDNKDSFIINFFFKSESISGILFIGDNITIHYVKDLDNIARNEIRERIDFDSGGSNTHWNNSNGFWSIW